MQSMYVLILLLGLSEAAVSPSPVYRSAPTILNPTSSKQSVTSSQPTSPQPLAEERESQAYGSSQDASKTVGTAVGNQASAAGTKSAVAGQAGQTDHLFQVYYYPGGTGTGQSLQQPQTSNALYPMAYQAPPSTGVSGSNIFGSFSWTDALVATAAVGLVAAGSAMWYPSFAGMKTRAMRELSELKSEDAKRVANTVMTAIRRFSEMNNSRE